MAQEEVHALLQLLAIVDTIGTVGVLVAVAYLFVSGHIMSRSSVVECCHETVEETIRDLKERGIIPPTPTDGVRYRPSGRSDLQDSDRQRGG